MNKRIKKGYGRKGEVSDYMPWIMNIMLFAIVIFLLNLGLTSNYASYTDTNDLEYILMNQRALSSLLYIYPSTGTIDNEMVDLKSFDNKTLEKVFSETDVDFGIKVTLDYNGEIKEIYYDKDNYEDLRIFRNIKLEKGVKVKDGDKIYDGNIIIENVFNSRSLI